MKREFNNQLQEESKILFYWHKSQFPVLSRKPTLFPPLMAQTLQVPV